MLHSAHKAYKANSMIAKKTADMDDPVKNSQHNCLLYTAQLDTPIGPMLAISDDQKLYLLEFTERKNLEKKIERLRIKLNAVIMPGTARPIDCIKEELTLYFSGKLQHFITPIHMVGSPFQQHIWKELITIPYGKTKSYAAQSIAIGNPKATRAVANANGANQLAIIIPCHRIIRNNGELGGYGGGVHRKKWLIDHEKGNI